MQSAGSAVTKCLPHGPGDGGVATGWLRLQSSSACWIYSARHRPSSRQLGHSDAQPHPSVASYHTGNAAVTAMEDVICATVSRFLQKSDAPMIFCGTTTASPGSSRVEST